jgi:eight-cysteine-cluster-containing protein
VPFVGPGDSCGGFVLPSFFERCEPGLQCVPSEPTGDLPGTCATCEYEGMPYQEGESFPAADGCNACTCMEGGQVLCTLMPCRELPTCRVAGCSGQLCVDRSLEDVLTTCEWRTEYECLQHSSCGSFGPGGACAWEPTPDYLMCREEIDSRIR